MSTRTTKGRWLPLSAFAGALLVAGLLTDAGRTAEPGPAPGQSIRVSQVVRPANAGNTKATLIDRANANAGQLAQNAANLARQWRPALVAELAFIRLMCPDLPQPQRARVKAVGELALLTAADYALRVKSNTGYPEPTPQSIVRGTLSDALFEVIPAEQWARFAAESAARSRRRQEAVIRMVVEHLDEELYLTSEQRDQIHRALDDRWHDSWEAWLQLRFSRNLPDLPFGTVTPFLDPDQRQAWDQLTKVSVATKMIMVPNANLASLDWWDEGMPGADEADEAVIGPAPRANAPVLMIPRNVAANGVAVVVAPANPQTTTVVDGSLFPRDQADSVRASWRSPLARQLAELKTCCNLSDVQTKKIALAMQYDVARFFEDVERLREHYPDPVPQVSEPMQREMFPLQLKLQAGAFCGPDSSFDKMLTHLLDSEQLFKYRALVERRLHERYRTAIDLALLDMEDRVPLDNRQHAALRELLLAQDPPPVVPRNWPAAPFIMYRISQIPADQLQPLFDEQQWIAIEHQRNQSKVFRVVLNNCGLLTDDQ